ncbi:hypothetical protein [Chryseobacterium foetidum]|uniref:hypothetical protein n=1 Tax=Chryseobacterium foetidum TaxID=2951057 RepID=UPI0021C8B6C6|nr:hypothetical protein [Chryseobacterium foetidum]
MNDNRIFKILIKSIIIISCFLMQNCKNYYYLKQTPPIIHEGEYYAYQLKFSNENLQFITPGDYRYNKVKKDYIYFKTKDINKILTSTINKPFNEQFLFMYTNMSIYNNLLGFYYRNTSLQEIKNNKAPDINLGNGILYTYHFGKFDVVDIYRECDSGVIRFININNPNEKDANNKRFHLEVKMLFFNLNKDLWDNSFVDFK